MPVSIMDTHHPDFDKTIDAVHLVRDAIEGPNAVKNGPRAKIYLPNPTDTELLNTQDTTDAHERYIAYKARAEYDAFPGRTESGYMGSLKSTEPAFNTIPAEIEYLLLDSDGDGLTANESIEITQANLLEVKYHGLLADFNGLTDNDINDESPQLTAVQAKSAGLRASIKHYPRESIVDWDYGVVNNQNQLTYVKLSEKTSEIKRDTFQRVEVENQLILSLDEDGFYFQVQITTVEGKEVKSAPLYPENNAGRMIFIPFCIVIDQKIKQSSLPRALGILYPICLKAISRYQVNADLKETLHRNAQPTSWSSGWTAANFELYKQLTGSEHVNLGSSSHIPLPKDSNIGYLEWNADSNGMFKYLEENQKEAKALGARFDTSDARDEAVGVAKLRSAEELSALINIQTSVRDAYIKLFTWCFWFVSNNKEAPEIEIVLNKEFNKVKLSPQEQQAIQTSFTSGLVSREEALLQLEQGGVLATDAETVLASGQLNGDF